MWGCLGWREKIRLIELTFFCSSVLLVCLFVNPCMLISLYRSTLCDACRLNVLCICYFFFSYFFLQQNERNGITSLTWVVGGKYTKKNITISTNRKSLSISVFISMFAQFLWFPRLLLCKPLLDWIFMFVYLSTEDVQYCIPYWLYGTQIYFDCGFESYSAQYSRR